MNVVDKLRLIFVDPELFFKKVQKDRYWDALKTLLAIYAVLGLFIAAFGGWAFALDPEMQQLGMGPIVGLIFGLVLYGGMLFGVLIQPWIAAAIAHIGAWLFDGKGDYEDTFRVMTYAMIIGTVYAIPIQMFQIVMNAGLKENIVVGMIGLALVMIGSLGSLVHTVYVQVVGYRRYHHLGSGKSFVSVFVIPLVIGMLLFAVLFLFTMFVVGLGVMASAM